MLTEFLHRHVSDSYWSYWQAPQDSVQKIVQELADYASKMEDQGGVARLGWNSEEIKGMSHDSVVIHDALHPRPGSLLLVLGSLLKERTGFAQRTITAGSETCVKNIFADKPSWSLCAASL